MINRTDEPQHDHLMWILILALLAVLGLHIAGFAVAVYVAVLILNGRKIK
jgi:hypothetical protein